VLVRCYSPARLITCLPVWFCFAACCLPTDAWAQTANPTAPSKDTTNNQRRTQRTIKRSFPVDPRWKNSDFPADSVFRKSPAEIAAIYSRTKNAKPLASHEKPTDGSLRIVGTGHSFMAPGYGTLPRIAKAAGLTQPPLVTHTGGGMTGSARYKWEQENGIFQFRGKPTPLLLASIANAKWDVMMWGPYYDDRAAYYACWIDFCLKHSPQMKFYLSDAWPQIEQLASTPTSESELTTAVVTRLGEEKRASFLKSFAELNRRYENRVFVLPTSRAMVLAVDYFHQGKLPGVDGIHQTIGGKERSLWRDRLGHLGRGIESLEGYVFYATLYGRSPELIEANIFNLNADSYPSIELDQAFREIAWKAVTSDPLTGITDHDGDKIADR